VLVLEFAAFARTKVKTLHKYLVCQVLASLLLTVAVFTFVLLIGDGLKEILPLLIGGQVRFGVVLEAIGLLIPFFWVYALPMGLLTATLLVFGRFSADQELTAARASGISLLSLVMPVLLLSLFCCGVSACINMDLGPRSRVASKKLISRARSELVNMQFPEGHFIRDIPGYIIYVNKNHDGNLQDIMVIVLQNETSPSTSIHAPRGRLETDLRDKQLMLHLFEARSVTLNGTHTTIGSSPELVLDFNLNAVTNQVSKPSISDMTFWQLRDEMNDLKRKLDLPMVTVEASSMESDVQLHEAEKQRERLIEPIRVAMHRQIAFSFACFSFTLIGIPLGIRVHRRETNIGVAMALVLVVIYYSFIMLGGSLSSRPELMPHLIFWIPNFIFQAVGTVLLWRANRGI
jgi:lipopolysaccharide export system permease protein